MQRCSSLGRWGLALCCNKWTPVSTSVRQLVDGKQLMKAKHMLRLQKAIKFVSSLNAEQFEKKKTIEVLHSQLLNIGELVPQELSAVDLHHMLTKCSDIWSFKKYMYSAYITEQKFKIRQHIEATDRQRGNWNFPLFGSSRQFRIVKSIQGVLHGQSVVFDLGYNLSREEAYNVYLECMECATVNLKHSQPLHLHFTSFRKNPEFCERFDESDVETDIRADYHEECFKDLFEINSRLVYLSPDGPPLRTFTGKETFIIGGIASKNRHEQLSYGRAQELGIRCASFPGRFTEWEGRPQQNLGLLEVVRVLLDINLHGNWERAVLGKLHPVMFRRTKTEELTDTVTIEV